MPVVVRGNASEGSVISQTHRIRRGILVGLSLILFLCVVAMGISGAALLGARTGSRALEARITATASSNLLSWFQHGLDLMQQGNYPLAEANFEAVLQIQPDNIGVQQLIATARAAQTPLPPTPTPTATPIITDKGELYTRLKNAFDNQNWDSTIALADQLRAFDAGYERESVRSMLYEALVTRGRFRLDEGDIEAGLYDLDIAATLQALDPQTEAQRQMAAMYQNALYYFGADWEKTIRLLSQVYALSPAYRDVSTKLYEAYVRAGDAHAALNDWCPAEARYAGAISVRSSTQMDQKHSNAQQLCLVATPTGITTTNGTTVTITGAISILGRIIYAANDPATGVNQLNVYDGASQSIHGVQAGGSQPSYQPATGVVAFTNGNSVLGLYNNGALGLLGSFSGAWPSVSPDASRIAYSIIEAGMWTIYVSPINGSTPPISTTAGTYPIWGPTGRIAYQSCIYGECGIRIINPDLTTEVQRLTTTAGDIGMQWSPDGNRIAYMTNYTGNWEIFTVSVSGEFRQLTSGSGTSALPAWSPDGSQIAFVSNRDGEWGIYVMSSSGGDARKLLSLGANYSSWQTERLVWTP